MHKFRRAALEDTLRVQRRRPVTSHSHFDTAEADARARLRAQDEEFCRFLRIAIETGRESCPIGVSTEPGTQNPIFVKNKSPESYY
jgi:hypothetical protein